MKKYIPIIVFLICSTNLIGQAPYKYNYKQGFKFISKAGEKLKDGDLKKAAKFIAKARASNFGFCGNSWVSANSRINLLEVQVLNEQKNYDRALSILDATHCASFGVNCSEKDSLKIVTLFLKHGKEKVINAFKKIDNVNSNVDPDDDSLFWVYVEELDYNFSFYANPMTLEKNEIENNYKFRDVARDMPFYKLLE